VSVGRARAAWLVPTVIVGGFFGLMLGIAAIGGDAAGAGPCVQVGDGSAIAPSANTLADIPGNYLELYQRAGAEYGLGPDGWAYLAAVGKIETNHGRSELPGVRSGENFAGAGGPMQFLSGTWDAYAVDGNGDGRRERWDPRDAIPGAARYLQRLGAPTDWRRALYGYNHLWSYVETVSVQAAAYKGAAAASGGVPAAALTPPPARPGASPTSGGVLFPTVPAGPIGSTPADHARRALGDWQSDHAVDISVPRGSAALAVEAGVITRVSGSAPNDRAEVIGGYGVTLQSASDAYYYGHLESVAVRVGERVAAGALIGKTGWANKADHLHIGVEHADPMALWGDGAPSVAAPIGGCPSQVPTGPAALGDYTEVSAPAEYLDLPSWASAPGYGPMQVDRRIAGNVLWMLQTYNVRLSAGRGGGHHSHGDGSSIDLVPGPDVPSTKEGWEATTGRLARDLGWTPECGASGVAPACPLRPWVRFVGYGGYAYHGDPWAESSRGTPHLHVSWVHAGPVNGALSAPVEWVRVFPVPANYTAAAVAR
jgi:murein DD-endopeptidase MepM/ murein hydrolase activator NlpD